MKTRILLLISVLVCALVGTVQALRPSGPGINTKANSLSVAIATDQPAVAVNDIPTNVVAATIAELDAGASNIQACKSGLWVETAGDGGLVISPYGAADAATTVALGNVPAGRLPIATQRVVTTGTSTGVLKCLNP